MHPIQVLPLDQWRFMVLQNGLHTGTDQLIANGMQAGWPLGVPSTNVMEQAIRVRNKGYWQSELPLVSITRSSLLIPPNESQGEIHSASRAELVYWKNG